MKKLFPILLMCLPLIVASCSCSQTGKDKKREDEPIPEEEEIVVIDEKLKVSDLKEETYNLFPYYYMHRLQSYSSYKAVTKGSTVATVLFIDTTQSIDVTVIKEKEYSYLMNESHSDLVNTVHKAYFHNDKVAYSGGSDYKLVTLEEYLNTFGTYPFDKGIEGYKINKNTIKEVTKVGTNKFKLVLDPETSTNNVKIQMREFGSLDAYPSFSKIEITMTVEDDFAPISLELESSYKATKVVQTSCTQKYTVTYNDYNQNIEIPDLDKVKEIFNA